MTSASFDAADEGEESAKEKRQHCTRKTHGMSGRRSEIGGVAAGPTPSNGITRKLSNKKNSSNNNYMARILN